MPVSLRKKYVIIAVKLSILEEPVVVSHTLRGDKSLYIAWKQRMMNTP